MTHVTDHNDLAAALEIEAARFHTSISIGGPFNVGDAAHVAEHNRISIAMIHLSDTAVATFGLDPIALTLPDVALVGDTGHIADHALFDAALLLIQETVLPW
jgi:hypothetical protein